MKPEGMQFREFQFVGANWQNDQRTVALRNCRGRGRGPRSIASGYQKSVCASADKGSI